MTMIASPEPTPAPAPKPNPHLMPMRRCGFCRGCGLSENLGVDGRSIGERPCWFCEGTGMVPDFTTAHYEQQKAGARS